MSKSKNPIIGTTCPALIKENYEYQLSGDCSSFCICTLNDRRCVGFKVEDPEDRSSNFCSRGKNILDENRLKTCPAYGISKESFVLIVKDKMQKQLNEKLNNIN
jgi:hypothetical protein